jgi:tRNA (cmo5U34)-methyltransferase
MKDDSTKSWDQDGAQEYLQYADLLVVERKRILTILERLFAYHFPLRRGLTMLELGCGDGFITESIRSKHPDNTFYLMDGSDFMIEKARERLKGNGLIFQTETFRKYLDRSLDEAKYDFVYSANAIHHLDSSDKKRLYSRVFRELRPGGLFINSDPVTPSSHRSEQYQFRLWTDWMREVVEERSLRIESDLIESVPSVYKKKPENKPDGLIEQLQMLQEIGFRDIDCFYKYSIFALFGGTK